MKLLREREMDFVKTRGQIGLLEVQIIEKSCFKKGCFVRCEYYLVQCAFQDQIYYYFIQEWYIRYI
jgi:hypothetical protein